MATYYDNVSTGIAQGTFKYPDIDQFPIVKTFLGNLVRLAGVPIHYLLPDEKCIPLPSERIQLTGRETEVEVGQVRFFFVDKNWVSQLIRGAIGFISDPNTQEHLRSLAMDGSFTVAAEYQDHLRRATPDFPLELNEASISVDKTPEAFTFVDGKPQPTPAQQNFYYSGFMLRSSLIAQWPGVEIRLQGGDEQESQATRKLRVVRMERLADNLLFVICEGVVTSIEIKQPPEMTHFEVREQQKVHAQGSDEMPVVAHSRCMDFGRMGRNAMEVAQALIARPMDITYPITIT
jgi:hypothetical protein